MKNDPVQYQPVYYAIYDKEFHSVSEIFEDDYEAELYIKKLNSLYQLDRFEVQPCRIVPRGMK